MAWGKVIVINGDRIVDEGSFHDAFVEAVGFPQWYGRNWDAWIDLMTYLDEDRATTSFWVLPGQVVTLQIDHAKLFKARVPEIYDTLFECSAFVNWRRVKAGASAYLCLSFYE